VIEACEPCLRRSHLIGHLAPRIAGLLGRPKRRAPGLLALSEDDLIAAVAGDGAAPARRFLEEFDPRAARRRIDERELRALCRHEAAYPAALRQLDDPPAVLFIAGRGRQLERLDERPAVAIVGSRDASGYALEVARDLGRDLAVAGVTVVSGLALGADAAAHRGALDGGGRAVGVVACGPDVVYPRLNRPLYRRVCASGAVLAELPPGQPVFRWAFPARNRIMAGLSDLTVVVEAAERSGSLITAAFAESLNRNVGAVPGRVTARNAAGPNKLLRDGASVIRDAADVLDELFGVGGAHRDATQLELEAAARAERASALDPVLRCVLDGIEAGDGLDAIARTAKLSSARIRAALGRLELLGLVVRAGVGRYERSAQR